MWVLSYFSLSAFVAVAVAAKHLAVLLDGAAAVAPGRDVVALHQLEVQLAPTLLAAVSLLLPHGQLDVVGKGPQVKVSPPYVSVIADYPQE